MICPKCHTMNDDNEKFCKNCGFQLNSSRICPECGKTNDSNSKYCKECGTVLTPVNTFRKQIIEENTKKSFFDMYKIPIICALFIILAVGAVAGMAFYNGSSGDDGLNTIIPTDNGTGFLFDDNPAQAQMQENATNKTNQTMNKTNDTNDSKTLTEKVNNTTDQSKKINQTKSNKNNKTKTITEKVENKTSPIKNKTSPIKNKTDTDDDKDKIDNKSDSSGKGIIPIFPIDDKDKKGSSDVDSDDDLNDSDDDSVDDDSDDIFDNDTDDALNDSDDSLDNDADDSLNDSDDSLSEIEMDDVPNLALKISQTGYSFSTIDYDGKELTNAQCIYILSEYLLNVEKGKSSPIEIKNVSMASSPSGEDSSQTIEKSDYLSIANRVHSWMDSHNSVPNYVGVSQMGEADLSPSKMLELFTQATLDYSVSGDLSESIDI